MIASVVSNHCPLLLDCSPMSAAHKRFHFEDYWLRVDGFHGTVATAWGLVHDPDPFRRLVLRLQATARRLTSLVEVLTLMVLTLLVCQGPIAAPRPQAGQPSQPQPECVHCRPKSKAYDQRSHPHDLITAVDHIRGNTMFGEQQGHGVSIPLQPSPTTLLCTSIVT